MKIKLIAFDLDGTLLTRDKQVTPRLLKALYAAHEKGIILVPATGRIPSRLPECIRDAEFTRYVISMNGAQVIDTKDSSVLYSSLIPYESTVKVIDYIKNIDCTFESFVDGAALVDRHTYDTYHEYIPDGAVVKFLRAMRTPVDSVEDIIRSRKCDTQKLLMFFRDMDERARQLELMPRMFPELAVSSSIPGNVELNYRTATKGIALERLCSALGIDRESTAAFGDGTNDISMIEYAGLGVAMDNAEDEVKAVADYIAPDCDSFGMAETVEKIVNDEL